MSLKKHKSKQPLIKFKIGPRTSKSLERIKMKKRGRVIKKKKKDRTK